MGCLGDRWHEISEGVELVDRTRQGYQNRRACSWPVVRGKQSNMGDGAGYIQSDELAVFWTRGAELTARMGLLMHQLQRERGLMTLHVADASWGAQCAQRQDHTRNDNCAN